MIWKSYDFKSQSAGPIGEVLDKVIYKCGFCKGIGFIDFQKKIKCTVCSSQGTVKISPIAVVCAYCNGKGRSFLNRSLACSICKGKGVLAIDTRYIEMCKTCKGRGKEKGNGLPCLTCRGKGVVTKESKEEPNKENNLQENGGQKW